MLEFVITISKNEKIVKTVNLKSKTENYADIQTDIISLNNEYGKNNVKCYIDIPYAKKYIIPENASKATKIEYERKNQAEIENQYKHLYASALGIVKKTLLNMYSKQGLSWQYDLLSDLWHNPKKPKITDNNDFLQTVITAFYERMAEYHKKEISINSLYKYAYSKLNSYIYGLRSVKLNANDFKTVYIDDIDGDIVSVNSGISKIINGKDYIPAEYDFMPDEVKNKDLYNDLIYCMQFLTLRQKTALKLLAYGYSYSKIADAMHISKSTVINHIDQARKKCFDLLFPKYGKAYKKWFTPLQSKQAEINIRIEGKAKTASEKIQIKI